MLTTRLYVKIGHQCQALLEKQLSTGSVESKEGGEAQFVGRFVQIFVFCCFLGLFLMCDLGDLICREQLCTCVVAEGNVDTAVGSAEGIKASGTFSPGKGYPQRRR